MIRKDGKSKKRQGLFIVLILFAENAGLEPATHTLLVYCSTEVTHIYDIFPNKI
jgi:hypothetical protein